MNETDRVHGVAAFANSHALLFMVMSQRWLPIFASYDIQPLTSSLYDNVPQTIIAY